MRRQRSAGVLRLEGDIRMRGATIIKGQFEEANAVNICENCKYLRRDYFIVERKVCTRTGKTLLSNKKSCKKFEPKYINQGKII